MSSLKEKYLYPALVISMIIWGLSWPSAKYLTNFGGVYEVAFTRFTFTVIGIFFILKILKVPFTINKEGIPKLILGAVLITGYSLLFFAGIKNGMPGKGGVLVTTMTPIVSYIIAMIVAKKLPNFQIVLGLFIGLVAALFLLHIWIDASNVFKSGNIFFLCSVVVWSLLSRVTAQSSQFGSPLAFSWWMYVLCTFMLGFFVDFIAIKNMLAQGNFIYWANLLFNAVINTGIATTVFFLATSSLGAAKTSSFIYIVPFAAAISSFIVFQEKIHWYTIVGGLLGIAAVWILNYKLKTNN